jgi:hypothetical protein
MNSPSSITFNVGAPTFGVRQICCRFCGVSYITTFPNWNGAPGHPPITLKTNSFEKPSSNTLNVGAPTFSRSSSCRGGFTPPSLHLPKVVDLKVGCYNFQRVVRPAVSQ